MIYPTLSEYVSAIEQAEDNFATLTHLRPVLGSDGRPFMSSGNFAVVFKMKDEKSGKLYAVKCFTKEQTERAERYQLIAQELEFVSSPYIITVKYLDKELFVDNATSNEQEFPVLLMDWIEGDNLDVYLRNNKHDTYALQLLAYQFGRMGQWLMTQSFAHGDIKPDNIIVKADGTLVLVDYDGMYVPAMKGRQSIELGSPDYRHPLRTADDFNEHIDDFSIASILCSLKALSLDSSLLNSVCTSDRLLFSATDYCEFSKCKAVGCLSDSLSDEEFQKIFGLFLISLSQKELSAVSFRLLSIDKPEKKAVEILSTKVTKEDKENGVKDEYGVIYSKDGKRLLKVTEELKGNYHIKEGTVCIGDEAFFCYYTSTSITIPNSVTSIGNGAFTSCHSLTSINIPNSVTSIGNGAFSLCSSLISITIPNSVTSIGNSAFLYCVHLTSIIIPRGTIDKFKKLLDSDYHQYLKEQEPEKKAVEILPTGVTDEDIKNGVKDKYGVIYSRDGKRLLSAPCKLKGDYRIKEGTVCIGDRAFSLFIGNSLIIGNSLTSITIPNSVTNIGKEAFRSCKSLTSITIPNSVTSVGDLAFVRCLSLTSIIIPRGTIDKFKKLLDSDYHQYLKEQEPEKKAVEILPTGVTDEDIKNGVKDEYGVIYSKDGKRLLKAPWKRFKDKYNIKEGTLYIGDEAFDNCSTLHSITLPNCVTSIGDSAFSHCWHLIFIIIPDSVTSIGNSAFRGCFSLTYIVIPGSVTSIGHRAFEGCSSLISITIPDSVTSIGDSAFSDCVHLTSIIIPQGTRKKFEKLIDSRLHKYLKEQ